MPDTITTEFLALRDRYIASCFTKLNPVQQQAVFTTEGPLLILAGAGSGKTTVLVNRIANIIRFGRAYGSKEVSRPVAQSDLEQLRTAIMCGQPVPQSLMPLMSVAPARPWNVLAITFTNKAAGELKERLKAMLGDTMGGDVFASTFHSACVRILRRDAEQLREHRVKAVGDVCECRALFAKREECKRQNLVRAVAREHLVPAHAERLCQRGQKIRARGVRIQAQVFRRAAVQRLQYLRAGRVRVFIRVQFDKGFHAPRLFPGRIGRNGAQRARQKTAHAFLCLPAPKIIFPARRGNRPGIGHRFVFRQALLYAAAPEE